MSSLRRKDPTFLRSCALYEFYEGKSAFKAYESFCKVFGDDAMGYREFLFWFERFAEGNFFLGCDISLLPKAPSLPDMPVEILEEIVKKTNWDGVIALRQVSRNIRSIVKDTKIVCKEVSVTMHWCSTTLSIDGETRVYERLPSRKRTDSDYQAFRDLIVLMKNSRIQVEKLCVVNYIEWEDYCFEHSCSLFPFKFDASLHVKVAHFRSAWRESYSIMKLLKPGTLEEIELDKMVRERICWKTLELDQWKQAKILKTTGDEYDPIPMKIFSDFVRFDINMRVVFMTELVDLKNIVLKSTNFEKCRLKWWDVIIDDDYEKVLNFDAAERAFGPLIRKDSKDPNYRQYVTEHENKVFKLKIGKDSIEIERQR